MSHYSPPWKHAAHDIVKSWREISTNSIPRVAQHATDQIIDYATSSTSVHLFWKTLLFLSSHIFHRLANRNRFQKVFWQAMLILICHFWNRSDMGIGITQFIPNLLRTDDMHFIIFFMSNTLSIVIRDYINCLIHDLHCFEFTVKRIY